MSWTQKQIKTVSDAMEATYGACGAFQPSPESGALMLQDLSVYPVDAVLAALARCRRELGGRLPLAAIIERIDVAAADAWPTPNEAWAMVGTTDEGRTVVCVKEAHTALEQVRHLLTSDEVGARMAFLDAYRRLVNEAREFGKPQWQVSLGHDKESRHTVLMTAVERRWIAPEYAQGMLDRPIGVKALPEAERSNGQPARILAAGKKPEREPVPPRDNARWASELLTKLADPDLAKQALEERRAAWRVREPEPMEAQYKPPTRAEVERIRAEMQSALPGET